MDLTCRFPQRSRREKEYIIVGHHYDSNAILAIAMKDRTVHSISKAWKEMHRQFVFPRNSPDIYIVNNKKSVDLIDMFAK